MTLFNTNNYKGFCISIHIPRVGDDGNGGKLSHSVAISIHIPRVGDDRGRARAVGRDIEISIHIPRVGDDK